MEFEKEISDRIVQLQNKYESTGQDLKSYLDGLNYANPLNYWDYLNVDALLSLQQPKTDFPDEKIFIMYHQITELYFKLSLHEIEQIANNGRNVLPTGEDKGWNSKLEVNYFIERLKRINAYFEALTKSFDIMVTGMEPQQFTRFRMSLLPASGFQSAQYRMIEICSTDFVRLVDKEKREEYENSNFDIASMFEHSYWKHGAKELSTGKQTLTLKQFTDKYAHQLIELAEKHKSNNLWQKYRGLSQQDQDNVNLKNQLRMLDVNVNVNWPLVHYKSAVRYLQQDENQIAATGGTNWQKYLPPRFQKRIFYPSLWSEQEIEEWGKGWVESVVGK